MGRDHNDTPATGLAQLATDLPRVSVPAAKAQGGIRIGEGGGDKGVKFTDLPSGHASVTEPGQLVRHTWDLSSCSSCQCPALDGLWEAERK